MDSSLLDEEFDNIIGEGLDGKFKVDKRTEGVIEVKTVEEDLDNDDDDDDEENKKEEWL